MSCRGRIAGTPLVVDHFGRVEITQTMAHDAAQRTAAAAATATDGLVAYDGGGPTESFYFCSHAHTDHTVGLSSEWSLGTIYCSQVTRALLLQKFGETLQRRIVALEIDQPHTIVTHRGRPESADEYSAAGAESRKRRRADGTAVTIARAETFTVTLLPSNHCSGSVMFSFTSSAWGTVLHTGDFRYDPSQFHSVRLQELVGNVDLLCFDATFLATACAFPKKHESIRDTIAAIKSLQSRHARDHRAESGVACPPPLDWRAYICCEGLGSEEIITAVAAELGEPFFIDESVPSLRARADQLRLLARLSGDDPARFVSDPHLAATTHLHLAPAGNFQRFAQWNRQQRADAKRKYRVEQELERSKLHATTMHAFSVHTDTTTSNTHAAALHAPPMTLYIKPSTQWFVHNTRSAAAGSLAGASSVLPLQSSYLGRSVVFMSRAEEEIAVYSDAAAAAPTRMLARADDRFGVTHILYAMHSDCDEIVDFIRFLRPRVVAPINVPCFVADEQMRARYAGPGHAPTTINTALHAGSAEVVSYVDRVLHARLPVEERPLVRGTDYAPTPRQNALARQHCERLAAQVQKMREWDAAQRQSRVTTPTPTHDSDAASSAAAAADDTPAKSSDAHADRRLRLSHTVSPLDSLGNGLLGSRWTWPMATLQSSAIGSCESAYALRSHLRVPFDPRDCERIAVHIERDVPISVREEVRARLERLGCRVTDWEQTSPTIHSNTNTTEQPSRATSAVTDVDHMPMCIPHDATFILLSLDRPSSCKLLLPSLTRHIESLLAASSGSHSSVTSAPHRDWLAQPVFICTLESLLWLESMNHVTPPPSVASCARLDAASLRSRCLTWTDVCVWNSRSKFQQLREAAPAHPERKPVTPETKRPEPTRCAAVVSVPTAATAASDSVELISERKIIRIE